MKQAGRLTIHDGLAVHGFDRSHDRGDAARDAVSTQDKEQAARPDDGRTTQGAHIQ